MAKKKYKVVIVGGGFGGVKAAIELCDAGNFDVTLISASEKFSVYPSLYHTATGGSKKVSTIPLSEVFNNRKINLVINKAVSIDRANHTVKTQSDEEFSYTALVLGLGVNTNYFNIKGLEKYSYGIKSPAEAQELKTHLHRKIKTSQLEKMHYVVVGGGPTGVELAGVLPGYIKRIAEYHDLPKRKIHVDLIEAAPRLLPRLPKDISKSVTKNLRKQGVKIYLNTAVMGQTADELMVHGRPIRSHVVIWTAGISNNEFFKNNNFQLTYNGKVRVDQFLQAEPGIYVIGDNADTPYSGMAQTALYDGKFVAKNLIRIANHIEPSPYKAKRPIYVMPAGPRWAAVLWGRFRLYGLVGWWLRRVADFLAYKDYTSWPMTFTRFFAEYEHEESCPLCADNLAS